MDNQLNKNAALITILASIRPSKPLFFSGGQKLTWVAETANYITEQFCLPKETRNARDKIF